MWMSAGFFVCGLCFLWWVFHRLVLHGLRAPREPSIQTPSQFGLQAVHVQIPTQNSKFLAGWFLPASSATPKPAIVVMHGWGANASMMLPTALPLLKAHFSVLLCDARCHGASDGETFTSMPRFAEDIEAGLDWLRRQPNVDAKRLGLMGHSVGAAAALLAAAKRSDVKAVVSVSAFAHPVEVMRRLMSGSRIPYWPLGWMVMAHVQWVIGARFDDIAPLRSVSRLRCPVLLVHGMDDEVVPVADAHLLLAAAPIGLAELVLLTGHHNLTLALEAEQHQLVNFFEKHLSE